jgi:anti-sigma factor (TIGR02949 family)
MICERVDEILDAYVSSELLVETCAEVNRHLARCAGCSAAFESRQQVKEALRHALHYDLVPTTLRERVRWQIRWARDR